MDLTPMRILKPYEQDFAAWTAAQTRAPTISQRIGVLSRLAGTEISLSDYKILTLDHAFRDAVKAAKQSKESHVAAAQELAHKMYPEAMRIHRRALKLANSKNDYRAVPSLTEAVWKRVLPLSEDQQVAPNVTITVTTERLAALAKPPIEVEVEELPVPDDRPADA